jgi:hypothetical protein
MLASPLLRRILDDEALTRNLDDAEARILVEWLVKRAEHLGEKEGSEREVGALCRRGRAIARFVSLWGRPQSQGAALQLAGCERFFWPLPAGAVEACDLMEHIVAWEDRVGPEGGRAA